MKRLFLRVRSDNEDYDADCAFATVHVTEELCALVKRRFEQAADMKAADDELAAISWWDTNAYYVEDVAAYDTLATLYGEKIRDQLYDHEEPWIEPHTFAPVEFECLRTEIDKMYIDEAAIWWEAVPKHSNVALTTIRMVVKYFLEILEEKT